MKLRDLLKYVDDKILVINVLNLKMTKIPTGSEEMYVITELVKFFKHTGYLEEKAENILPQILFNTIEDVDGFKREIEYAKEKIFEIRESEYQFSIERYYET